MSKNKTKLTVLVTEEEKRQIEEYAMKGGKNMNQYMVDQALNREQEDKQKKLKRDLIRNICWLNQAVQTALWMGKKDQIPNIVTTQGHHMAKMLEE